jgi:hypothetical protein
MVQDSSKTQTKTLEKTFSVESANTCDLSTYRKIITSVTPQFLSPYKFDITNVKWPFEKLCTKILALSGFSQDKWQREFTANSHSANSSVRNPSPSRQTK